MPCRILTALAFGINERWKKIFFPRTEHCPDPRGARTAAPTAVRLHHFYGLMLVFGALLMLAAIVLLVEVWVSRRHIKMTLPVF